MSAGMPTQERTSVERSGPAQSPQPRRVAAFLYAAPIGVLGDLMGLGGAEFRLPVKSNLLDLSIGPLLKPLVAGMIQLFLTGVARGVVTADERPTRIRAMICV